MFQVTKTYGHEMGLSACFRQHKARSHCRFLHGYALSFKLVFAADELDENNWVIDFGGLKTVKAWLCDTFDHKMLVAEDDPALDLLLELNKARKVRRTDDTNKWDEFPKLADILVLPYVGCEGFAYYVYDWVRLWLEREHRDDINVRGLHLQSVEVREHAGNSAIYSVEAI